MFKASSFTIAKKIKIKLGLVYHRPVVPATWQADTGNNWGQEFKANLNSIMRLFSEGKKKREPKQNRNYKSSPSFLYFFGIGSHLGQVGAELTMEISTNPLTETSQVLALPTQTKGHISLLRTVLGSKSRALCQVGKRSTNSATSLGLLFPLYPFWDRILQPKLASTFQPLANLVYRNVPRNPAGRLLLFFNLYSLCACSSDKLQESVPSSHHVGSGDQSLILRLGALPTGPSCRPPWTSFPLRSYFWPGCGSSHL